MMTPDDRKKNLMAVAIGFVIFFIFFGLGRCSPEPIAAKELSVIVNDWGQY